MAIKYESNFAEGDFFPSSVVNNIIDSIKENEINIDKKIDKVDGKGLSTNDYTDEEKQKNANNAKGVANNAASIAALNLNKADNSALLEYVKSTDYASYSKAGVSKVDPVGTRGISIDGDNFLTMVAASPSDITGRIGNRAITPLNLNAAVKAALTDGSKISNMTETEKKDARDVIGAEKMTTIAVKTTSDVFLNDKVDTRVSSSVTTINLILPTPVLPKYESAFSFQSGTTATTLAYPGDTIKFVGVDCDESGDFIPTANKNYEIIIKNLTTDEMTPVLVARVGVY